MPTEKDKQGIFVNEKQKKTAFSMVHTTFVPHQYKCCRSGSILETYKLFDLLISSEILAYEVLGDGTSSIINEKLSVSFIVFQKHCSYKNFAYF